MINNTKDMAKKDYKSPKMNETKVDLENLMTISGSGASVPCDTDLG